ncbi:hypothetical protein L195_g008396 [Trifolium pratense]|uniref:Uncharacterized protein n=1 Tax=Trifolium pratense TaxID=57577 RepID=A0A2K3P922_TRIPR|nr:hypothetical protein L195_g008396 [Trifolium pratense]
MFFTRSNRRVFPLISLATKALHSTHIVGDKPVLVRDSIHSALYHFSQKSRSIGVLPNTIRFNQLQGRKAYMKYLDNIYKQSDISWFTPVEIFKGRGSNPGYPTYSLQEPWYAHAIAEAIMRTANFSVPLKEEARGMDGSHWLVVCEPPFEIKFVEFYADYYAKLLEPYVGRTRRHLSGGT